MSDIFRSLLTHLIASFTLQNGVSEESSNKRRMIDRGLYTTFQDHRPQVRIEGETIAYVISQCVTLGLNKELEELFGKMEEDLAKVESLTLDAIIFPFLDKFLDIQVPLALSGRVNRFVQSVISSYIKGYVQMEPARHLDWTRDRKGCGCADCDRLDQFLVDPQREIGEFSMAEKRRNHLSRRLCGYLEKSDEYDLSTIRAGSPYTLAVRKSERGWRRIHAEWVTRCQKASRQIEGLGQHRLKKFLGVDAGQKYDEFIQLRIVKLARSINGKGCR